MRSGHVETVWVERYGTHLVSDAAVNDTVLEVSSTADLDDDGGQLQDVESGAILDYATIDPEADTVTLTDPLATALSDGDTLRVYPLADDLMAHVRLDDAEGDEVPLTARVAHSLRTVIAEGVREGEKESVLVEESGAEWVVRDVIGIVPVIDGTMIDPETAPPARDGLPPDVSPAPEVLGGIGALYVRWTGVSNNDPVVYEVHLSTTTGFTPDATTLATETNGTLVSLRSLPDSTDLVVGTTYYVRLVAKDLDGSADASSEASGQLAQANTPDIAVNAITADQILANAVTADKVEANAIDGMTITGTTVQSTTFVAGSSGWRADASGDAEFYNITARGDVTASRVDVTNPEDPTNRSAIELLDLNGNPPDDFDTIPAIIQYHGDTYRTRTGAFGSSDGAYIAGATGSGWFYALLWGTASSGHARYGEYDSTIDPNTDDPTNNDLNHLWCGYRYEDTKNAGGEPCTIIEHRNGTKRLDLNPNIYSAAGSLLRTGGEVHCGDRVKTFGDIPVPRIASGHATVPMTDTQTPPWGGTENRGTVSVPFPADRFTTAPNISVVVESGFPVHRACGVTAVTSTGFDLTVDSSGTGDVGVYWTAIEEV